MIGILSDAHGNIEGFKTAIKHLYSLGVNRFIFLGDAVGYIPSLDVLHELAELGDKVRCILGNHDLMLVSNKWDKRRDEVYKMSIIAKDVTDADLQFIRTWPTHIVEEYANSSALYVHGGPNDFTNEYVYPDSDLSKYSVKSSFVFMGHTHYPFIRKEKEVTYVNVGSCGMSRDIGILGCFATFDPDFCQATLYRFNMSSGIDKLVKSQMTIHQSIIDLFKRSKPSFKGQLIDPT